LTGAWGASAPVALIALAFVLHIVDLGWLPPPPPSLQDAHIAPTSALGIVLDI
jgi:hypothetical protein